MPPSETIVALASAPGKCGVAVIRLSGPAAFATVKALTGTVPPARVASLQSLRDGMGAVLDTGLVVAFPGPASFTGEDVAELQLHGSPAVVRSVIRVVSEMPGVRVAEAGEFTRRALQNGKLDLAQVEALHDLVEAETEAQRIAARQVLDGRLAERIDAWRTALVEAAALLEVTIDFSDDEVPGTVVPEVRRRLQGMRDDLAAEVAGSEVQERLRLGFEVAIVGRPNAGKSTLLNAMAGREAALTSTIAGTTRDVIEVSMDIDGLPVTVLDTAGLRVADDSVERLGVDLARRRAAHADLRVWLLSEEGEAPDILLESRDIVVRGRTDLVGGEGVSGRTGEGVADLLGRIGVELRGRLAPDVLANRERHRAALIRAVDGLDAALGMLNAGGAEMVAFNIREAASALERLIGRVGVEDMLDEIFSRFCLGK